MKKKLLTAAILLVSAALLVAASILGTLSFLASSAAVSNTFTVGNVKLEMFESRVNADGQDDDGADRTSDGNSYKLIPNKTYCKDPALIVKADSVPSYLFVKVKNGIQTIEEAGKTMKEQMVAHGWQLVKANDTTHEELYLYVGANATATIPTDAKALNFTEVGDAVEDQTYPIFDTFTIAEDAIVADYAGAKVTLTGFAIQVEGFENNDSEALSGYQRAWNAIVHRFPYESGTEFAS